MAHLEAHKKEGKTGAKYSVVMTYPMLFKVTLAFFLTFLYFFPLPLLLLNTNISIFWHQHLFLFGFNLDFGSILNLPSSFHFLHRDFAFFALLSLNLFITGGDIFLTECMSNLGLSLHLVNYSNRNTCGKETLTSEIILHCKPCLRFFKSSVNSTVATLGPGRVCSKFSSVTTFQNT